MKASWAWCCLSRGLKEEQDFTRQRITGVLAADKHRGNRSVGWNLVRGRWQEGGWQGGGVGGALD